MVKPHSAEAIRALKAAGVRKTVMLTGDAEPVAKAVSAQLGLDEYHAGLLPGDKVDQIEKRCCPAPMWASPWVPWAPTPPLKPPTWC